MHSIHQMSSEPVCLHVSVESDVFAGAYDSASRYSEDIPPTQFEALSDLVLNCCQELNTSLTDLAQWKDEILGHTLPAYVLLRLLVLYGRVHRSTVDLQVPILELVRIVRLYAHPWQRKSVALQRLHEDYDINKRHLDVALRRVTMTTESVDRLRSDRLYMHWERLFSKLLAFRRHGRRWKFLIDSFHELMREGKPVPVVSDSEDDSSDDEPVEKLPEKPGSRRLSKNLAMGRPQKRPGNNASEYNHYDLAFLSPYPYLSCPFLVLSRARLC
jgi:hypothetical protein